MNIEISRPELEALIQKRLKSGAFDSVEEIIFRALEAQDVQEDWLRENQDAINEKIELAMAQLDRGEGIPVDQLRARLETRKAEFLAENGRELVSWSSRLKSKRMFFKSGAICSAKRDSQLQTELKTKSSKSSPLWPRIPRKVTGEPI